MNKRAPVGTGSSGHKGEPFLAAAVRQLVESRVTKSTQLSAISDQTAAVDAAVVQAGALADDVRSRDIPLSSFGITSSGGGGARSLQSYTREFREDVTASASRPIIAPSAHRTPTTHAQRENESAYSAQVPP